MTPFSGHVASGFPLPLPELLLLLLPLLWLRSLLFVLALAVAAAFAFALAFALALAFASALALAYIIHVHWICLSEVIHDPRLVRVQLGLDDRSQLVVVTLKLLRVHQQMVSQFLWAFPQHHADLHVIVQLCWREFFVFCPPDVPTTSTSPQTLPDYHSFPAVAQLAASRISDPRFSARSRPPSVSTLRTQFCSPISSFVPWSVSPARRTVCVWLNVRMVVCRRHITAPLPCASFACSVTRSTTTEFQHNDIMMKTTVQNDLRLEMALESMWILCS